MRRVSMATRDELVAAVVERYGRSGPHEKARILDAFVAVTGFHRKHAMRVLRTGSTDRRRRARPERRLYDEAVREALIVVWEASDRVCARRRWPLRSIASIRIGGKLVIGLERHDIDRDIRERRRIGRVSGAGRGRILVPLRGRRNSSRAKRFVGRYVGYVE